MARTGERKHGLQNDNRYRQLYRVIEGPVAQRDPELHRDFSVVVGALENPSVVEAALALWVFGSKLIGVDWADIIELAGDGVGLARVIPQVMDVVTDLAALRSDLTMRGFGDGFVLIQLFSPQDESLQSVQALDDLATSLFQDSKIPVLFTSMRNWVWSRTVLIGFKRQNAVIR